MVAKSYQNLEIIGEPFSSKGRLYIQVKTKGGILKTVRWYSEKEYLKMYPNDTIVEKDSFKRIKTQKEVLGFTKGYITIFKGNTYEDREYFQMSSARYSRLWGWYFISTEKLPEDIPEDVEPITLPWEIVGNENETLKNEDEIISAVEALIYDPDISEYQGKIGDRLDLFLTVEKAISLESYFSSNTTMHIMRDDCGNCYVWTTAAKTWSEGTRHHLTGTVKDYKTFHNIKQTILTRCLEKT